MTTYANKLVCMFYIFEKNEDLIHPFEITKTYVSYSKDKGVDNYESKMVCI